MNKMIYVSADVETTSLIRDPANVLMMSFVIEDTSRVPNLPDVRKLPHFTCFVNQPEIKGSAYALGMNGWILDIISGRKENTTNFPILTPEEAWSQAISFLKDHFGKDRINLAGKNAAGFDYWFFPEELQSMFRARIIDPGSVYIDWKQSSIMGLDKLKKELGISGLVTHDAYDDACDVILSLREDYKNG